MKNESRLMSLKETLAEAKKNRKYGEEPIDAKAFTVEENPMPESRFAESKYDNLNPSQNEGKYVDYDEEQDAWCIFGDESGFCYGTYASEEQAESALELTTPETKMCRNCGEDPAMDGEEYDGFCQGCYDDPYLHENSYKRHGRSLKEYMEVGEDGQLIEKEDSIDGQIKDASISELARMIRRDWKKVYFGAVPYLDAMRSLESVNDSFGYDDGRSIIRYFLANAAQWKGELARKIKKELNDRVKGRMHESVRVRGHNLNKKSNKSITGDTSMKKSNLREKLLERLENTTEGQKLLKEMGYANDPDEAEYMDNMTFKHRKRREDLQDMHRANSGSPDEFGEEDWDEDWSNQGERDPFYTEGGDPIDEPLDDDFEDDMDSEVDESCDGMDECGGVQFESKNRRGRKLNEGMYDEYDQSLADDIEDMEDEEMGNRKFDHSGRTPEYVEENAVEEIDSYPVDESQMVSNAGDAVVYVMADGDTYEVITWNSGAEDHEPGSKTLNFLYNEKDIDQGDDVDSDVDSDSELDEACEGMDECGGVQFESKSRRGRRLDEAHTGAAFRSGTPIIGGADFRSSGAKNRSRYEVTDEMLGGVSDQYGGIRLTNDDIFAEGSYERNMSDHVGGMFDDEDFVFDMNRLRKPKPASKPESHKSTKPLHESRFEGFKREEQTIEDEFEDDMGRYYIDGHDPDEDELSQIEGPGDHTDFDADEFEEFESGVQKVMGHVNRMHSKPEVRKLRPERERQRKFNKPHRRRSEEDYE